MSLVRAETLAARIAPRGGLLPHVTGVDGRWELLSPLDAEEAALTGLPWTGGFVAGQLRPAGEAARAHLEATIPVLLREDGSTFHAARIDDDGRLVDRGTINGYAAGSTWARGQAWAMHGLATAARATGGYREEAERSAQWFLDH